MKTSTRDSLRNDTVDPRLGAAIERDLRRPLAAVRAILDTLCDELAPSQREPLRAALEGLADVDRAAEALEDIVRPRALAPLPCTLGELVRGAWAALPPAHRERVWLAIEDAEHPVHVDGPVLVRALAALLEDACASPRREVLVHAHEKADAVAIAIVDDLGDDRSNLAKAGAREPIGLQLARRDLRRLGGDLEFLECTARHRTTLVRLAAVRPEANGRAS